MQIVWAVLIVFLTGVPCLAAWAEVFEPDDRLVSDPDVYLADPEFDPVNNLMTWQDLAGDLWLATIDTQTGDIIPADGRGLLVDSGLASAFAIGNGPEFGYGAGEVFLCYTKLEDPTRLLTVARKDVSGTWIPSVQVNGEDRFRPLCTPPGTPDLGRLVYVNDSAPEGKAVSWRDIDDETTERSFDMLTTGGRWAEGERAFVSPKEIGGILQLFWVDIDADTATQITFDSDDKFNAFLWQAPEYGDQLISAAINFNSVGIFRRIADVWTRIYTFQLPSAFEFVSSPEAFVHNGKSYIAVIAARELRGTDPLPYLPKGPSQLWIANIDADAPFFRRIDRGGPGLRKEPEPFVLDTGPAIYFTENDPVTGKALVHVADTGLGSVAAGDSDGDGISDDRDSCTFVANPSQRDEDADGIGTMCDTDLNNDCVVDNTDIFAVLSLINNPNPTPIADFNSDGITNYLDFFILTNYLGLPPGPASPPNLCDPGS
jgi:hypothetical protein